MTNIERAQAVWRSFSGDDRYAFRDGSLGRSQIVADHGEAFNKSGSRGAWAILVKLSDAWARGEEDDGSDETPYAGCTCSVSHMPDPGCRWHGVTASRGKP